MKIRVSPTQNYSSMYVDLGAIPDDHTADEIQNAVPPVPPLLSVGRRLQRLS